MNINNNKKIKKVKKTKKNNGKKNKWKKILILILMLILIFIGWFIYKTIKNGGGLSGMLATVVGHDENTKKNLGEFKVLILGISTDQENVDLTDTIMIASYNPNTQKATLLSIPRDTYTGKTPSRATSYEKINALYNRKHRPDETLEAVNKITGLDIKYYVVVKTEALIKLVDVIGGVKFNVPIDMDYDDTSQDLHIHLKAGEQILDGDKAEQLVRFRHNNDYSTYSTEYGDNDTGRMRTQREFITQVLKQTLKPENIFKLGQILEVAHQCVTTNVSLSDAKDYIPYAVEFNTENLVTGELPGTNTNKNNSGVWIFIHDSTETKKLITELFHDRDIEETNTIENNTEDTNISSTSSNKTDSSSLKIEVLNGSGNNKTLSNVTELLKKEGYNITKTGTTNMTAKTTILNKKGIDDTILKDIKEKLGTGVISNSKSTSAKVDITIIIGKDY